MNRLLRRLSSDELKSKSAKAYKANYHAAVARIMEQRMGICLAAIMTCVGLRLRGNAEKEKIVGGIKKKLPFR